jgi:Tfp pilus assembly protein PilF
MSAQKITIEGFLDEFQQRHEQMADRPFCWVLGSGASIQSGIPSGKDLALQWLAELHKREDFNNLSIEEWATAKNLEIPGFEYTRVANFYPWIYQRRFRYYKEQGYAFLEKTMDHAEPSFGYSVLAQIMATTHHKVAITTNFDNLIADALSIYTRIFPLVCGHESLTGYIRPNLRRPLVAKIHRDLLLAPLSSPDEIDELPIEWSTALTKIFDRFTPIVIGYGGNDGSLMGYLRKLAPIEGGVFWCHREGSDIDEQVHEVVEHHHGKLVPIAGFDELMLQLQEKLQLPFLLPHLQAVHDKRIKDYQKQFEALATALRKPAESPAAEKAREPARKAAEAAVERLTKEKNWWAWELKVSAEEDAAKKDTLYRAGLEDFPESAELTANFAVFMEQRKNYAEAKRLYERAYQLDPNNPVHIGNFAWSLHEYEKDYERAEQFYRKALELDPTNKHVTANFAVFMEDVRRDYDEAERLYRKVLELDPKHVNTIGNFALFMKNVRKNYDEAERLFREALELDPNSANRTGNFATFVARIRKNSDEAERLYRKALELDPHHTNNTANFAQFLGTRERFDEASDLSTRAWQLLLKEPDDAHAEVAFTRWLLDRAARRDGRPALGRLKTSLQRGFVRSPWSFDDLLNTLVPHLPENEHDLAHKLAAAILDESKLAALDDEPIWKAIVPIPLDVPWPDSSHVADPALEN